MCNSYTPWIFKFLTVSNLFKSEVVQKCQCCALRENSNANLVSTVLRKEILFCSDLKTLKLKIDIDKLGNH